MLIDVIYNSGKALHIFLLFLQGFGSIGFEMLQKLGNQIVTERIVQVICSVRMIGIGLDQGSYGKTDISITLVVRVGCAVTVKNKGSEIRLELIEQRELDLYCNHYSPGFRVYFMNAVGINENYILIF